MLMFALHRIAVLVFSLWALACSNLGGGSRPRAADEALSEASLRETVVFLAGPALKGRASGTEGDLAARDYIEARMTRVGLKAPVGGHQQAFTTEDGASTSNVIGVIPGADPDIGDEIVIIGAHHDHLGAEGASVFAGANDNASGVAVLLGIAEAMARRAKAPRRTLVFVTFGAEEDGLLGSEHYVESPPPGLSLDDTVFMFNLDMVGRYPDEGVLYALHTFEGTPGRTLLDGIVSDFPALEVDLGTPGEDADHLTFCDIGVPTTFFFTEDSTCYHRTCDTVDHVDFPSMAKVAALAFEFTARLADSSLDLAAAREEGCAED